MAKEQAALLVTPTFRGSYVHLDKPHRVGDDPDADAQYDMVIVLPKKAPETVAFIKKLTAAILGAGQAGIGKPVTAAHLKHYPIRDGDVEEGDDFKGMWMIGAKSKFKIHVVGPDKQPLVEKDALDWADRIRELCYSGAWFKAAISPWFWSNKFGKGVSLNLNAVQKIKDDEAFGGGIAGADVDWGDEGAPASDESSDGLPPDPADDDPLLR